MTTTLQSYLQRAAQHYPANEALRLPGATMTYRDLDRASNQTARALLEGGLQKGDRVGIHVHKSFEAVKGFYGALKAGGVFVPLDPMAPPERVQQMIVDCGIRHLITNDRLASGIGQFLDHGGSIDWILGAAHAGWPGVSSISWDDVNRLSDDDPGIPVQGSDIAYIFYTSGTTGEPKGMVHTHQSGLAFVDWAAEEFGLVETDRITSHAPLHFDLMLFDYIAAASAKACTVIVPEAYAKLPASLLDLIEQEAVSIMFLVPTALTQMLLRGGIGGRNLESIRRIIFGGEIFPNAHLAKWMRRLPEVEFTNVYGVTECNVCTYYHVPGELPGELPLGLGLPIIETRLIDELGTTITEAGVAGELLVAGSTVMQGYWNRPGLTRDTFTDIEDGKQFLRTGDVVKRLDDGHLMFVGRADRQIKMRGNRVQLQDVEQALISFHSVEEASALPVDGDEGSTHIVAVVVNQGALREAEFSTHLHRHLPWYAIPQTVLVTANLPRTSSGKLDMQTLEGLVRDNALASIQTIKP